jgi:tripeptidyl-peptidase I
MVSLKNLSVLLALSSSALTLPTSGNDSGRDELFRSSIFEKLAGPPAGWVKDEGGQIDKDVLTVKLRIHLVQQDLDKFHDLAMKVI